MIRKPIALFMMFIVTLLFMVGCQPTSTTKTSVELSDAQIENIVRRSYQYVAMYNVNNKFALKQGGWNTVVADTQLKNHTMRDRPHDEGYCAPQQ